jgi:hypothetical protein
MDENEPLEWYERLVLQVVVLYMGVVVALPAFGIVIIVALLRLLVAPGSSEENF